ncbi:NADH dehydrogenase [Labilithrix luteola]|uniref:NADH dehydrogenase n=1 Tax=Labilithrix luteola TaxID=1391654 RepID=A0A0K1PXV9_9BACT|nr:FAD-dependent oxidoreductase [Labilithrix luteola]AKU98365.1 NADH dehydrogenase [Labilithrix luteola]
MSERIVILGAGYAGMLAALRASRRARGRAEMVLVNADDHFVERIRLHQHAMGESLRRWSIASLLAGTGVRFEHARVQRIDPERRIVALEGGALPYDRLVLALGSRTEVERTPGVREHAFTLDANEVHTRGATALAKAISQLAVTAGGERPHVVVCGGGLCGVEVVTELVERFPTIRASLVTASGVGTGMSPKGARYVRAALARRGIDVLENIPVRSVHDRVLEMGNGSRVGFDVCVWTGGFVVPPLARDAGLSVNERGQVFVDACLRSVSHPRIYAAGDMAMQSDPPGAPLYMSCKAACPMGLRVGDNVAAAALGREERPFAFISSGLPISLGRADGVLDTRRNDGTLRNLPVTGRLGAWVKEAITGSVITLFQAERWFSGLGSARPVDSSRALPTRTPKQLSA